MGTLSSEGQSDEESGASLGELGIRQEFRDTQKTETVVGNSSQKSMK